MWIDHVEQSEEHDQDDWNIDCFGRTAKGIGKGKGKEKERKAKEETETPPREDSKENDTGVKN